MIKTIIKAMYSAFISIILISLIIAGWTCFAFISQPTKSGEIINVIQDIYESQKSVIIDVIDLSRLLIKDKNERIASEENNHSTESEFPTDQEDNSLLDEPSILEDNGNNSLLDEPSILEDNGNNSLGIVIEPSLPEASAENSPKITVGPFDNDQSEVSMSEMELGMDMN